MARPVHEGYLQWQKKKGLEDRYFVLYEDRLEYFTAEVDFSLGKEPRGCIATCDIENFTVTDHGFTIRVGGKDQEFVVPEGKEDDGDDARAWAQALMARVGSSGGGRLTAEATPAGTPAPTLGAATVPQDATPGAIASLCQGSLSVERKGKMVQRYFILLEDRLHYYEDAETAHTGQDPRGCIMLSDILRFEEADGSFRLQSRNEKKFLEFHTASEQDLAMWVSGWSTALAEQLGEAFVLRNGKQQEHRGSSASVASALPAPVPAADPNAPPDVAAQAGAERILLQGRLGLVKDTKLEPRHFILFTNRFEYYSTEEDYKAGVTPRGQVGLQDVRGFEVASEGSLVLTLTNREIGLWAATPEVAKSWGEAWAEVLQATGVQVAWSQPGADSSGGQARARSSRAEANAPAAASPSPPAPAAAPAAQPAAATQVQGRRSEAASSPAQLPISSTPRSSVGVEAPPEPRQAWPEGTRPICQGHFDVEDSGYSEGKSLVLSLFQDRLEYFPSSDSSAMSSGVPPKSHRILMRDIEDLEVLDAGFTLHLHDARSLRVRAGDDVDLNQWLDAFSRQLQLEVRSTSTTATPGSTYSGSSSPTSWPVQEGSVDIDRRPLEKRKPGASSSHRRPARQPPKDPIIHQGSLFVQRHRHHEGQVAARPEVLHVAVFRDRFEYYASKASMLHGVAPEGQVHLTQVQQVRVQDAGFVLGLGSEGGLNLRIPAGQDMQTWIDALWMVFDPDRLAQGADAGAGTGPGHCSSAASRATSKTRSEITEEDLEGLQPRRAGSLWSKTDRLPEKQLSEAEILQEDADPRVELWLAAHRERPCQSGILGFRSRGKMVMRYAVMFKDRLDIWEGPLAAASGWRPSERIPLQNIRGVEAVFGGFILNCGGRRIGVHVSSNDELRAWSTALLGVIAAAGPPGSGGRVGGRSRSSGGQPRKQDEPAEPKKLRPRSAGWVPRVATLAAKPQSDSPALATRRKTEFTLRSQGKGFQINTHKACGTQLHGSYALVMPQAGRPGGRNISSDVAGKVNECHKTPRLPRGVAAEIGLADKVTGHSLTHSPRKEPGSFTWLKCNHPEATPPPKTPRSAMEPRQPFGAPYAVQPGSGRSPFTPRSLRRTSSAPVTGKVNEVPWGCSPSTPSRTRQQQTCCPRRPSVGKITDAGRERSGWVQSDRPATVDKNKRMADREAVGLFPS